ncbi:uncharacterized protein JCM6883_002084 [Sporobolomyces salmoneus]|uniref:uncharacterized protein n=1 Tax=Sporobolomyces salmoneus TaxID=183962 RepID=UPI00316CDB8C
MPTPSGSAVHQLVVPNLPRVNDRFSSTNALFIACYKSILPIFGHGVILSERTDGIATIKCGRNHGVYDKTREGRCHWELGAEVCSSTGEAVVKQALSHLVHNHGPSSKILKNPNYRPVIINPIIREAFGMDPLASGKRREKETSQSSAQARPRAVQRPSPTKQVNSIGNSRPPQDNERSYPAASPFSLPSRSSQHVNGVVRPRLASLSSLSRPLAPSSFSDQLESFLEGLDPSLSGLAPILSEEGIDSLKTLVLICSMSPLTIDHFIESLCEKAPLIFLGYLKLFGKLLKQAQEGEYNT